MLSRNSVRTGHPGRFTWNGSPPSRRSQLSRRTRRSAGVRALGADLQVPPDKSVLEVIRAAGVSVLASCLEGVCGTCETEVIDGDVDHRDSVLNEEEQAANEYMMVCVSRCRSPRLTLDL